MRLIIRMMIVMRRRMRAPVCIHSRQTAPAVNCRQIKGDQVEGKPFEKYSKILINFRERPSVTSSQLQSPSWPQVEIATSTYFYILKWILYSFSSLSYLIPGPRHSARHFNEQFDFRQTLGKVC